jgi:hypothetical protein
MRRHDHVGGLCNQSRNLLPPTPHYGLHPTARDYTQQEGREESHCDFCASNIVIVLVKHWSCVSDIV